MKEFWNERYKQDEFAFGEEPNEFFKSQIVNFKPGKILFPAEGEGRNAVYAAKLLWDVSAFDLSLEGKNKAQKLATKNSVQINYQVGDLSEVQYNQEQFDAIVLIYAHFHESVKSHYHETFKKYLKKGGVILIEAFSEKHLEYNSINEKVGGPKDLSLLYSIDEIKLDFDDFEHVELLETEVELNEGLFHVGKGSVIRFIGIKK